MQMPILRELVTLLGIRWLKLWSSVHLGPQSSPRLLSWVRYWLAHLVNKGLGRKRHCWGLLKCIIEPDLPKSVEMPDNKNKHRCLLENSSCAAQ
jgi:hypothetical protein